MATDAVPTDAVPTDAAPTDTAPTDTAPTDTAPTDAVPTDVPGSRAAGTAPVEGYEAFSIAQLRGRLRGYAPTTVEALLAYEEATRAREPYLRMLRNRLERLTAQEVETSPLSPRGA